MHLKKKAFWAVGGLIPVFAGVWLIWLFSASEAAKESAEKQTAEETGSLYVIEESPLIFSENPAEENLADMLQTASAGVMVQITAGGLNGSGIFYGADGRTLFVATAAHVLEQAEESVQIKFRDGFVVESSVWKKMKDADLAFIQVDSKAVSAEHLKRYFTVNTDRDSFDRLQSGDGVIVMGSKDGVAENAYEGTLVETWIYLEDFSQYMMVVSAPAMQGMSGGGVFDQRGRFIGILCGGNEDGELAVLPLSIIEAKYLESACGL